MTYALRLGALATVPLISVLLTGCEASGGPSALPSESFSGPAWEAYKDGKAFGSEHQAEGLPTVAVDPSDGISTDTFTVNSDAAEDWCADHLSDPLLTKHDGHSEALTEGCVAGVYPAADHPEAVLPFVDK
jgi:hypothetical protein